MPELTNGAYDTIDTGFWANADPHNHFIVTVSCDGEYDSSFEKEWGGFTLCNCAKLNSGGVFRGAAFSYYNTRSLIFNSTNALSNVGVNVKHAAGKFIINRGTDNNCPRVMSGNYTVNIYAVVGV